MDKIYLWQVCKTETGQKNCDPVYAADFSLSVTLTVLITHTAGTILIRDRKNSVRRNVNVAKEFIETELNGILSAGLSITMSNAYREYYSSQTKDEQALKNIIMLIQMAMDGNSEIELITLFDNEQTNLYTKASQARYKAEEDIQRYYEDAILRIIIIPEFIIPIPFSTCKRDSLIDLFSHIQHREAEFAVWDPGDQFSASICQDR